MTTRIAIFILVVAAAAVAWFARSSYVDRSNLQPTGRTSAATRELSAVELELLDIGYDAVARMPEVPHAKNRARGQHRVVEVAVALGHHDLAARYAAGIDNWRQGLGYAEIAYDRVLHGARFGDVASLLDEAGRIAADRATDTSEQKWRPDRIKARIAATHLLLGRDEEAQQIASGLVPSELGFVFSARAETISREVVLEDIAAMPDVFARQDFEQTRAAYAACATLYRRFFTDAAVRKAVEDLFAETPAKVARDLVLGVLLDFAETAAGNDADEQGRAWLQRATRLFDTAQWRPEHGIPLKARIARLHAQLGDADDARTMLKAAQIVYDGIGQTVPTFELADVLRPVAEAYVAIGDLDGAATVYRRAVDDGAVNPNARCRADDLQETCCSMVRSGFQPDAALLGRIRAIRDQLGEPW